MEHKGSDITDEQSSNRVDNHGLLGRTCDEARGNLQQQQAEDDAGKSDKDDTNQLPQTCHGPQRPQVILLLAAVQPRKLKEPIPETTRGWLTFAVEHCAVFTITTAADTHTDISIGFSHGAPDKEVQEVRAVPQLLENTRGKNEDANQL
eukprot:CAMPEP_0181453708 /NCGR_PEP_ID=MMETSP1110-20121109/29863_1 /TAXON_ID=174948 /ORGANISM="Symbiodinium sp., Strain CCMP421" /LENGTH=148 /DNA_ID=CAMNT_0023578033 /DNA_START=398 /DNA_END=844 /DNA_ORIENTATION=-